MNGSFPRGKQFTIDICLFALERVASGALKDPLDSAVIKIRFN